MRPALRTKQIALTTKAVKAATRIPGGRAALRLLQQAPLAGAVYRAALGYRRPFATLAEAAAAVAPYMNSGHENAVNAPHHMELSASLRPSEYPVLFHLAPHIATMRRIYDLGGNAGNLFYAYKQHLTFPAGFEWIVNDLPANMAFGEQVARERGETRVRFTPHWSDASGADALIISGALHYMERPLAGMLGELSTLPKYIVINRTPLTEHPTFATIQDATDFHSGDFRIPALLLNRTELIASLEATGYQLKDEWKCPELSFPVPGYPELTVWAYSGMFLEQR